jgi:hypothetical protein
MEQALSKQFVHQFPAYLVTEDMRNQALDVEFHWVTEHGQEADLTTGARVKANVSGPLNRVTST